MTFAARTQTLALGLAMTLWGGFGCAAPAETSLQAALDGAKPGAVVVLPPGSYPAAKVQGVVASPPITVTGGPGVRIGGLDVRNSDGLVFQNLEIAVDPRNATAVNIRGSRNVRLERLDVHGEKVNDGTGVNINESQNVTLANSELHLLGVGVQHLNSSGFKVLGNSIHDLRGDAIKGGGSSHVEISGNTITDMFPQPGDHADAIQFWTFNTTAPTTDIRITDNVFTRGKGGIAQGIFMGNEAKLAYEDVTITGNTIFGAMYNGLRVDVARRLTVTDNFVQGMSDMNSWIFIGWAKEARIRNNVASAWQFQGAPDRASVNKGNKTISLARKGDRSAMDGWRTKRGLPLIPATPAP